MRVLLIENDPVDAAVQSKVLHDQGFEVMFARTGAEGIAMALKHRPGIIFTDIGLDGPIDGYAVARECRAHKTLATTPIIAITKSSLVAVKQNCALAGINDVIVKPVNGERLIEQILGCFEPERHAAVLDRLQLRAEQRELRMELDALWGQVKKMEATVDSNQVLLSNIDKTLAERRDPETQRQFNDAIASIPKMKKDIETIGQKQDVTNTALFATTDDNPGRMPGIYTMASNFYDFVRPMRRAWPWIKRVGIFVIGLLSLNALGQAPGTVRTLLELVKQLG